MAELAFERLLAGLEAARGTPTDPPIRFLNLAGTVSPKKARYRPEDAGGVLAEYLRSADVRRWSEWEAEGALDVYVLPTLLNTIAKGSVSVPQHPAGGLIGKLDLVANVANGETVTIGADVYEVDIIDTDSTDDTAGGNWNNTTDPLTIDCTGFALLAAVAVGDLIRIENEIMKITAIDPVTDEITFDRARCGTAAAAHADAKDIFVSDAPGMANIPIGLVTTLTAVQFATALEPEVLIETSEDITLYVSTPGAGQRCVEVMAGAQQALMTLAETLAGAGNAWQADTIRNLIWDFAPTMNADDLQSMTLYWGDPGVQEFQTAYNMVDELSITADDSGTDGVTMAVSGQGYFPSKTGPAAVPTMLLSPLLAPAAMEVWIDSALAIGTTRVVGRVVSAEITVPSGVTRKWTAVGPGAGLDFAGIGRGKRHAELKLVLEVPDMTQYDQWVAETVLKARVRLNGPAIVSYGLVPASAYYFTEFDIYGPFDTLDWGEHEGTNRTIEVTILSEYDASAGYDWRLRVQNNMATL